MLKEILTFHKVSPYPQRYQFFLFSQTSQLRLFSKKFLNHFFETKKTSSVRQVFKLLVKSIQLNFGVHLSGIKEKSLSIIVRGV